MPSRINTTWLVTVMVAVMLSACGQQADEEAANAAKVKQAASSSQAVIDPFVKAVQVTVGESPVEVRFELPTRPVVGEPVPLRLRLTGLANTTALTVKLSTRDHLQVVQGGDWTLEALPAGQAQAHEATLSANANGIFVVDVAVDTTRDGFAKTFTFALPVAVPEAVASSSAAASVASATSK